MKKVERYFYPAVFTYEPGQEIAVTFPDLDVATSGENEDDALISARELLGCVLYGMEEDGEEIPAPTRLSDVDTKENEERKKVKAAKDLAIYGQFITERKVGMTYLTLGRWPRVNSRLLGGFFTKYLITDKHFRVVANKCIGCKTCAAVCPVNNIVPNNDNMPQWKHNNTCLTCFACYHHCPTHAIEFGIMTHNKGQYYFK